MCTYPNKQFTKIKIRIEKIVVPVQLLGLLYDKITMNFQFNLIIIYLPWMLAAVNLDLESLLSLLGNPTLFSGSHQEGKISGTCCQAKEEST